MPLEHKSRTFSIKVFLTGLDVYIFQLSLLFFIYRNRTRNIDVTEITRDIYKAERAQDKANDDLETASLTTDMTQKRVADVKYDISVQFLLHPTCFNIVFFLRISDH